MTRSLPAIFLVGILTVGCATGPASIPAPKVVEVDRPVPCMPAEAETPPKVTGSKELLAMTARSRYLTIAADREAAAAWLAKWGPAVAACSERK